MMACYYIASFPDSPLFMSGSFQAVTPVFFICAPFKEMTDKRAMRMPDGKTVIISIKSGMMINNRQYGKEAIRFKTGKHGTIM
jgi:hypothetical protein